MFPFSLAVFIFLPGSKGSKPHFVETFGHVESSFAEGEHDYGQVHFDWKVVDEN